MLKKNIFILVQIILILISPLIIAETLLLSIHHYKYNTGFSSPYSLEENDVLGWSPKPNYNLSYQAKDYSGETFQVVYKTESRGFRLYGDINSNKKKILFVGDSFTHARDIDALKTFYGLFSEEYEIFAYGSSGHGTWQQYLVLKMFLNEIKPDLVIWQHHVNDLFDNVYELDLKLGFSGFLFDRPYPTTTRLNKNPDLNKLIKLKHTRLGHYLSGKYLVLRYAKRSSNIFEDLKKDLLLNESLKNFQVSLDKAYALAPETNFMHFFITHDLWFEKKLKENVKFNFLVNEFSKHVVKSEDISVDEMGHWNKKGHERVYKFLAPLIRAQF